MTEQPIDDLATAAAEPEESADPAVALMRDRWQRALAELDNTRRRAERLMSEQRAQERVRVTAAWLPVLDNLDRALSHAAADPQAIVEGVTQVREQAQDVLSRLGFEPIEDIGEPFDPLRHEAAEVVRDGEIPPGTVVRVIRPGYGGQPGMLRPAIVAVSESDGG